MLHTNMRRRFGNFIAVSLLLFCGDRCMPATALPVCPPGKHYEDSSKTCISCTDGVDFTSVHNRDSKCTECTKCTGGRRLKAICNVTRDTLCQCETGEYVISDECLPAQTRPDVETLLHKMEIQVQNLSEQVANLTSLLRGTAPKQTEAALTSNTPATSGGELSIAIGVLVAGIATMIFVIFLATYTFVRIKARETSKGSEKMKAGMQQQAETMPLTASEAATGSSFLPGTLKVSREKAAEHYPATANTETEPVDKNEFSRKE